MSLPGVLGDFTTLPIGFFEVDCPTLASWVAHDVEGNWTQRPAGIAATTGANALLTPSPIVMRYLCLPWGTWTALFSDGPAGTDASMLPSVGARELQCRTLRALDISDGRYQARILEVYGPRGHSSLALERSVALAGEGGHWEFKTFGTAYPFEDLDAYQRTPDSLRFSSDMLYDYLLKLGVPADDEPAWDDAIVVTYQSP